MLAIKFRRQGKKHQASYRIVVAQKRSKMRGRFVDDLGWFDPHSNKFDIKKEKVTHWMQVGAKPTDSVHNLLVKAEVIPGPKVPVHSRKPKKSPPKADQPRDDKAEKKEAVKAGAEEAKPEISEEKPKEAAPAKTTPETEEKTEGKTKKSEEAAAESKPEEKPKEG